DWRQSAKTQHYYVREREWEAAETVRFWRDASAGMRFASSPEWPTKLERATVLALALGALLVRAGERIGIHGDPSLATTGRVALHRMAHRLTADTQGTADEEVRLPPEGAPGRHTMLVWLSDFLEPVEAIEKRMSALAAGGIKGFLVQINDPAEEDFPFS